ncbi:MAG: RNA-binding cell elongation regulator Jag/EloR [Clostridia bacterium]
MIKEAIATGETNEIAFKNACDILAVSTDKASMEVIENAVKKTFGLFGGSLAKVRAYYEITPAQKAAAYVKDILTKMDVANVEVNIEEENEGSTLKIVGEDVSFIIGHRGDTLDSLQYLASLVANQGEEKYCRISIDVGSFREKRKETLQGLGKKIALKALRIGRNQILEPMNPYERRIIHTAVQEVEGVKSWSEGTDLNRHVVIGPVDGEKPRYNKNNRGFKKDGFNKDGFKKDGFKKDGFKKDGFNNNGPRKPYNSNSVKPYNDKITSQISETAPVPYSPAPLDEAPVRKKVEDAPLYGRIK